MLNDFGCQLGVGATGQGEAAVDGAVRLLCGSHGSEP